MNLQPEEIHVHFTTTDGHASSPKIRAPAAIDPNLGLAPSITLRGSPTFGKLGLNGHNDYLETMYVNSYHRGTRGQIGGVGG